MAGMTMAIPSTARYKNYQILYNYCLRLICDIINIVFAQIVLNFPCNIYNVRR